MTKNVTCYGWYIGNYTLYNYYVTNKETLNLELKLPKG